jgi:signal transduction histidine kinase
MPELPFEEAENLNARINALERLVSVLRHDIRGALSSARLVADRLHRNPDPAVQRSADVIERAIQRVLDLLAESQKSVPPRGGQQRS